MKERGDGRTGGFHGKMELGGVERIVSGTIQDGKTVEIEVMTLRPGDTFCDVAMSDLPIKFQKRLRRQGLASTLEIESFTLTGHAVSMYLYEDELASICWSDPVYRYGEGVSR